MFVYVEVKSITAKWIPKCLNVDQKWLCVHASHSICAWIKEDSEIFLKKFSDQKSDGKLFSSILLGFSSIWRSENYYLQLGTNKIAWTYLGKRQEIVDKGVLLEHKAHSEINKIRDLWFKLVHHSPYLPKLVPHYYLFSSLKKRLKGRKFSYNKEVIAAVESWVATRTKICFWKAWMHYSTVVWSVFIKRA